MAPPDPSSQILSGRVTKSGPRTPSKPKPQPNSSFAAAAAAAASTNARSSPKYGWCPDCRFGTRQRRLCDPEGRYPGKWSFVCSNKNKGCRFWELLAEDPMLTLPPAPSRKPVCPQCSRGSLVEKCKDVFNFKDRYLECSRWKEAERPCDYRRDLPKANRAGPQVPFALRRDRPGAALAAAVPANYEEPVVDLTDDMAVPAAAVVPPAVEARVVEAPAAGSVPAAAPVVDLTDETQPPSSSLAHETPPSSTQESDYGSDFWNQRSSQPPEREAGEAAGCSPATLGREDAATGTQYSDLDPVEESLLVKLADDIERSVMASASTGAARPPLSPPNIGRVLREEIESESESESEYACPIVPF
ncbi:hypothetical protein B0T22DRAFT_436797 [Podospora appendiculata]|uniref:Uncharacterized protein n=1 Tax=Podospora appendiculata TaxID=314037 RepID=A0AAE0XHN9_9PEZI|nr:hypothetical protein B0T22DRAFT_436797 [Podospora appendiculata]